MYSGKNKVHCANIYRPPQGDINLFFERIEHFLSSLPAYVEVIVTGDFNIDLLNIESNSQSLDFVSLMSANPYIPMITKPTRIAGESYSLIDNIFIIKSNNVLSGNIVSDLSDHYAYFFIHRDIFIASTLNDEITYSYRIINDVTLNNLYIALSMHDFGSLAYHSDIDVALTSLLVISPKCDHLAKVSVT